MEINDTSKNTLTFNQLKELVKEAAFNHGIYPMNETRLSRIIAHGKHGFIIVSANRSEIKSSLPENDLSGEFKDWCKKTDSNQNDEKVQGAWLSKRNKLKDQELQRKIISSHYAFSPVYGGYRGIDGITDEFEPSYIIYCHSKKNSDDWLDFDDLFDFALDICKEFQQDSVYIQRPDEAPIYVNRDGVKLNSSESKNFKYNDFEQAYFTTLKRKKSNADRFTADIGFDESSMFVKHGPSDFTDRVRRIQHGEIFLHDFKQ